MPMRFDLEALRLHAQMVGVDPTLQPEAVLRQKTYEACLRVHKDPIEAVEVRTGLPWNEWGSEEQQEAIKLARSEYALSNPLLRSFFCYGQKISQ